MKRLSQAPVPPFDRQAEAERLAVQRAEAEMRSASSFFYECDCVSEHKIESEVVGCRFMATAPHGRSILLLGGGISVPLIVEQQIVRVPQSL